ncbi:MAG: hypothetical protein CVV42_10490 [Candidatus Riflebacteria bacterium HGW-Riflebacteria-2]|nr:MAG: hypothetical protein CVV42_10490 [Candidatus Riflebacteria bacterium HGW-Riflebacteria-2]
MQSVNKKGFSLAELMVAFGLAVFVIGLSLYFFYQANTTAEDLSKRQHLLNVASSLTRALKKDLRSSTEAGVSTNLIRLQVNQLDDKSGLPECKRVVYEVAAGEIVRREEDFTRKFSFSSLLKPDDHLSLAITHSNPAGSGFFLEIYAENSGGVELIRLKERLVKIDITKPR